MLLNSNCPIPLTRSQQRFPFKKMVYLVLSNQNTEESRIMIIRKKETWFRMLFIWEGSVLPRVLPRLILLFFLSVAVVYFHGTLLSYKVPLDATPFTLFGFVLALFLGFRNNASYERFWEGRKLWGSLLNVSRALTRQVATLTNGRIDQNELLVFVRITVRSISLSNISYVVRMRAAILNPDYRQNYSQLLKSQSISQR